MSRAQKHAVIEKVEHGPFHADIRLNKESGVFSCEYGSQQFSSHMLPEVRSWVRETLRDLCKLQWHPVMEVSFDDGDNRVNNLKNCSNIECYIERFNTAWDGKKWIKCPWVVMPPGTFMCVGPANSEMEQADYPMSADDLMAERVRRSREWSAAGATVNLEWPIVTSGLSKTYYVQYTEERWQTMLGIIEKIRELRAGINRLLATEQGWRKLAVVAQTRLLTDQKSPSKASASKSAERRRPAEQSEAL